MKIRNHSIALKPTKHDVVLFIPNTRWYSKRPWLLIPHSALILTSLFNKEFGFDILDANAGDLSKEECLASLAQKDPKIFLVSGVSVEYFEQYHKSFELAKTVNRNCITVFGGIYPTLMPHEALEDHNIDYIFVGPSEGRASGFLRTLLNGKYDRTRAYPGVGYRDASGRSIINPIASILADLKDACEPDYSLLDVDTYLKQQSMDYNINFDGPTGVLLTSYGCKYNCIFCAARTIRGRGTAYRSAENVIEEIEWLMQEHGVKHLSFLDELFLGDRKRAETIMKTFIARDYNLTWKMPNVSAWHLDDELLELMKMSGCKAIVVSVESGSERVLHKIIRKPLKLNIFPPIVRKCKELGIDIVANFVIGLPDETWNEIRQTFRVAEELDFDLCSFHIATPYPGTDLFKIANKQKLLPEDFDFRNPKYFGTSQGFITTKEFTPFELMVLRSFEWDRINFKTPEKVAKIAKMMNMSVEQLNEHRKQTRLKCGVHY
jgi:anaerobic magnesium-protoporphyrin IX monomethyl ester cyclase